jgi:perosamine synthetase
MTSGGEGGMLFTDDDDIAAYARDHRDYDNRDDFKVRYPYKMTELQAAVGRVQLRRLAQFIERRREIAEEYFHAFEFLWLRLPAPDQEVCFRYVVATPRRPDFETFLLEQGIEAKRPVFHPAHHYLGGVFPKSEQAYDECLSLPLYPLLTQDEVQHVIESVQRFFE